MRERLLCHQCLSAAGVDHFFLRFFFLEFSSVAAGAGVCVGVVFSDN
jgi:hypothetical protein